MGTPIKRILAAVDLSSCSRAALELACSLAASNGGEVEALFVVQRSSAEPPSEAVTLAAKEELHRFVASVAGSSAVVKGERVVAGDARACIVESSESGRFDAIVLGTHGRTGRPRSLAGSVAEGVVRTASCPVVTVREG